MKAARLALGALIVTGLAPGQSLKDRQGAILHSVVPSSLATRGQRFWGEGVDPEQMDRDSGFMKFEYSRGTITRNVKGHLQAWTYSKGSLAQRSPAGRWCHPHAHR